MNTSHEQKGAEAMTLTDTETTDATAAAEGSAPKLRPGKFKVKDTEIPKYVPLHAHVQIHRKEPGSNAYTVTIEPSDGGQWGPEDLSFNEQKGKWMAQKGSQCVTFDQSAKGDRDLLQGYFSKNGCVFGGGVPGKKGQEDPDVGVWGAESPPKLPPEENEG
jgi:hypothetical protein